MEEEQAALIHYEETKEKINKKGSAKRASHRDSRRSLQVTPTHVSPTIIRSISSRKGGTSRASPGRLNRVRSVTSLKPENHSGTRREATEGKSKHTNQQQTSTSEETTINLSLDKLKRSGKGSTRPKTRSRRPHDHPKKDRRTSPPHTGSSEAPPHSKRNHERSKRRHHGRRKGEEGDHRSYERCEEVEQTPLPEYVKVLPQVFPTASSAGEEQRVLLPTPLLPPAAMDTDVEPAAVGEGDANANTNVGTLTRGKQNWTCKEGAEQDSSCQTSKRLSPPQSCQEEGPQGSYSTSDSGLLFSQDSSPEDHQGQSLSKQKGTIEEEQNGVSDDKHRTRDGVDETGSDNALGGEFRGDGNEAQTEDQEEYFWEQVESIRKGYSSEERDDTDHLNREMLEEERLWDSLERQRLKEDPLARREKQTFGCHPESLFNTFHSTAENEGDSFVAQTQLVQPIASGKEAAVLRGTGNLATIRDDFPVDETLDRKHSAILMALHPQNNREVNVLTLFEANGLPAFRQYYCVVTWGDAKVKTDLSSQSSSPAWNLIFIVPAALLDEGTRNLQRLNPIRIEVFCKKRLLDELMGLVKLKSASNTAQWFPLVSKKKELTGGQLKLQYKATSTAQRLSQQLLADQQNLKQKELGDMLDAYSVPSCPILFLERHKESFASSPSDFVVVQAQREGSYPQQIASQSHIDFSLLEAALANSTNDPGVAWTNYNEQTFLHLMCLQGNPAIVARLTDNGADINALDGKGSTPLHLAAANGHLECVKVLLDRHADPNVEEPYTRCSPLHHAAQYNQTQVLQLLIESGATVDHKDRNGALPIHKASAQGHLEAVQILLGAGAFLHAEDREGNNAFLLALLSGHSQVSAYLLEQGADGRCHNTAGDTPLWGAAVHLDKCMVEKILCASKKYGIDLNSQTGKHKQTLLHRCVLMLEDQKAKAVIKLLISMGANVNVLNGEGKTPLFIAAYLDRFPLARMLLKRYNAAADVRDAAQNTALFFCSTPRMAKLLLRHGAEVNAVNLSGNTPLHAAYCFHGASVAWVLRQAGASTAVLNCNNNSPEDLLWSYGVSTITISCTPLMANGGNAAAINNPATLNQRTLFGGLHIPRVTSFSPKELSRIVV